MPAIAEIFATMDYGPAPEAADPALAWLDARGRKLKLYINGQWVAPQSGHYLETSNPATNQPLARIAAAGPADVDAAVAAARAAFPAWSGLPGQTRARYLYAIARHIQKHSRLLAVLESLDNGKPIRETRDLDIPLVARHFYYHAGWAQLMAREFPDQQALGVVGQIIPWNFPLLMLAWKIAPALAMGNTVVLKPAKFTALSALAFAEIVDEIGLPPGVVNIVTGDAGQVGETLVNHPDVDKIAFTGSTDVGRSLRRATAGSGKRLSLELGGKSPFVVFDDADLDSVVEGVVDAIWFNQGQVCCAGSRLLVQENIAETLYAKLRVRMEKLRVGDSLDKAVDIGAIVGPTQLATITRLVQLGVDEGATLWQPTWACPTEGCYFPPTLFTNVAPAAAIAQTEIFGPVMVAMTFRTPSEAVALANNTRYGLAASVWSDNLNLALDIARRIKAGTVWVNCTNLFDAAAGFGGYRESGFGREGGREGLYEYLRPVWETGVRGQGSGVSDEVGSRQSAVGSDDAAVANGADSASVPADGADLPAAHNGRNGKHKTVAHSNGNGSNGHTAPVSTQHSTLNTQHFGVDRTPKLYIGGKQARPDSGYSRSVHDPAGRMIGEVGEGNRKDIRNAVEAARKAEGWANTTGHARAQILYYIAENLAAREQEFAARIVAQTGSDTADAAGEVATAVSRLFTYAAWADKFDGQVHHTPLRSVTVAMPEAVGVIGIACPTEYPLLGLVSLVAPAIAMGNTVVAIPSEAHPLSATDLYQVFDTSDLPGGVVNLVTGAREPLVRVLADHDDVDAVWYCGTPAGSKTVEHASAGNMKRTWVDYGHPRAWLDPVQGEGPEFLREATQVKNIWVPYGE
ncbi:MAG: aldehyde dehydrogenase family protein [Chloroflexota bacterium]|nr:aldehyde dehydrogenase family protein [Chloroflexota bacterium]